MLSREWLSAFVPLGVSQSTTEWRAIGSGMLLHDPPVIWLVTANHVVDAAGGQEIAPLVTAKAGGKVLARIHEFQKLHGYGWHVNESADIAVTLMPVSPDWDIKAIDDSLCIGESELVPSMPCYTVGCPYEVMGFDPRSATPLVLDGIISGLNQDTGQIYTSVPTFPGNSGGPIIVRRANSFDKRGSLDFYLVRGLARGQ